MTNTNWRKRLETVEFGFDVDGKALEKFIDGIVDQALKDQKAELLEKMPKEKEYPFFSYESEYGLNDAKDEGFNDCLEIIKGLIKGDD